MNATRIRSACAALLLVLLASAPDVVSAQSRDPRVTGSGNLHGGVAASRRVLLESGTAYMCLNRGRPVARALPIDYPTPISQRENAPVVFVSHDALAVRDANQRIVLRELPSLRQLATLNAAGVILYADPSHVFLWRREAPTLQQPSVVRTLVRVDATTGHETVSHPMPLPDWVLATNDPESAENVRAVIEGSDVVVNWDAARSWTGGIAPSEDQAAAAHHEDCGSLRVGADGSVVEGSYIPIRAASTPPATANSTRGVTSRYAGDGLYWIDTIDRNTGMQSSALADRRRARVPVVLPAAPHDSIPMIERVWAAGSRVVVLRGFHQARRYSTPREVTVFDRATGAVLLSTAVAPLEMLPPRP